MTCRSGHTLYLYTSLVKFPGVLSVLPLGKVYTRFIGSGRHTIM